MDDEQLLVNKANDLIKNNQFKEARNILEEVLTKNPSNRPVLNQLSILTYRLKDWHGSLKYSLILLESDPSNIDYLNRIGQLYLNLNDLQHAENYLLKGQSINDSVFNINYNLGKLHELKGDNLHALEFYQKALLRKPDSPKSYRKLATFYYHEKSLSKLKHLIQMGRKNMPDVGFLYDKLLSALHEQKDNKGILETYLDIFHHEPGNINNLMNIGLFYENNNDQDNAFTWYKKVLEFKSEYYPLAFIKYAYYRLINGIWDDFDMLENQLKKSVETYVSDKDLDYRIPIYHLMHFNLPRSLIFEASKKLSLLKKGNIQPLEIPKKIKKEKLKIGYISPRVHKQANMILYYGMFKHHDRSKFEIYMYALSKQQDEITDMVKKGVDTFKNCAEMDSESVARMILDDQIDILYSTAAHLDGMRMEILAFRPAPIIINGQGYNESPGADYIDYCLIDKEIMTEETKSVYAENLLVLSGCALNNSPLPVIKENLTREDVGLPLNKFIYACLCHPRKLHPDHFVHWAQILKDSENTIAWFNNHDKPEIRSAIIGQFNKFGVDQDQLYFTGKVNLYRSWNLYPLADLFLDTFYYNSHTVAIESLRMGLPVITIKGKTHNSRYCGSILKEAGLNELICKSKEEYVKKSLNLSKDQNLLKSYRKRLKSKDIELFDTPAYVSRLENAFDSVWNNYVAGYPNKDFYIN